MCQINAVRKNRTISKAKQLKDELNKTSKETCSFENVQYFNTRYKILPTPFQWYSSYMQLNVLVTEQNFNVWAIYSVTYTPDHTHKLITQCIYGLHVIVIASEE